MKVKQQQHININLKTNAHNLNHMCLINGSTMNILTEGPFTQNDKLTLLFILTLKVQNTGHVMRFSYSVVKVNWQLSTLIMMHLFFTRTFYFLL